MSDLSRVEQLLRNALGEDIYEVTPQSRVEALLVELNELIEEMGSSVSPEAIATAVAAYLDEHLTNPTSPPVDTSLTIAGAAADAKEVGDRLSTVKEDLNSIVGAEKAPITGTDAYITLSGTTANINSPVSSTGSNYIVLECAEGDEFTVTTSGGKNGRAWGFLASDGTVLVVAPATTSYSGEAIVAPANSTHLVVNGYNYMPIVYIGRPSKDVFDELKYRVDFIEPTTTKIQSIVGGEYVYPKSLFADAPTVWDGYMLAIHVGETLTQTLKVIANTLVNYIVPVWGAETVSFPIYKVSGNTYGALFLDEDGVIVGGRNNHTLDSGTIINVNVPQAAKYLVLPIANTWGDWNVTIYKGTGERLKSIPLGLHTMPTDAQLNAIKRARQITDIKWTPALDLARTCLATGDSYMSSHSNYYSNIFTANKEYKGLPYSNTKTNNAFRMLGVSRPFDVFATSVVNERSVEMLESVYSQDQASYYGSACTGLTAYALGIPYVLSGHYNSIGGMVKQYNLITNGVRHSLENLQLADILQINGHCAMVSDIVKNDDGELMYIEIAEQTRQGNCNKSIQGGEKGGLARRIMMTVDEFFTWFDGFAVYRYSYLDTVKYIPSPYSAMVDEGDRNPIYDFPLLPYHGNKYLYTDGSSVKLLINCAGYTHVIVNKNGTAWNQNGTTNPYSISNDATEITIQCDADDAEYTAQLATIENDSVTETTVSCRWYVKSSDTVSVTLSDGTAHFVVTRPANTFAPYYVKLSSEQTMYGGFTMLFDTVTVEEVSGGYRYSFDVIYSTAPSDYRLGFWSDNWGAYEISGTIS